MTDQAPLRILVVDDEPSIRLLVRRALEKNGFVTDVASDGVEALRKLEEQHFDLLILDLMMPRLDGFDVVEQIAQSDSLAAPKILIMTAASPSVLRDLPADRVQKIINKPFEIQTLVRNVIDVAKADER